MITTEDITLVMTCSACPEQYDAFIKGKNAGYLRLRHGWFTVSYRGVGGDLIYESATDGDGAFTNEEAEYFLLKAKKAIIQKVLEEDDLYYFLN